MLAGLEAERDGEVRLADTGLVVATGALSYVLNARTPHRRASG